MVNMIKYQDKLLTALVFSCFVQTPLLCTASETERVIDPDVDVEADISDGRGIRKGGALFNSVMMGDAGINISGSFTNNLAYSGGAIYNDVSGVLNTISAVFEGNTVSYVVSPGAGDDAIAGGGALFNAGTIGHITASSFTGNSVTSFVIGSGGAIYNSGTIGADATDGIEDTTFANNHASNMGGAIYNDGSAGGGKISSIVRATFTGNSAYNTGGAICNEGTIGFENEGGIIDAVFTENVAYNSGGAISNHKDGYIAMISGSFEGNRSDINATGSGISHGGAIYNSGDNAFIGKVEGSFIDNAAISGSMSRGGAIYNTGTMGDIDGTFRNNMAKGTLNVFGGAIHSDGTIGNISGEFVGNYVESEFGASTSKLAQGGALRLKGIIGNISAVFSNNYAKEGNEVRGGAIWVCISSKSDPISIQGSFNENYAENESGHALGGAIHIEDGNVKEISGVFEGNYTYVTSQEVSDRVSRGGVLYNYGNVEDFSGSFTGNSARASASVSQGGVSFNAFIIKNISGDFSYNYAVSETGAAAGGAIFNHGISSLTGNITGSFTGNYARGATARGGAIFNEGKFGKDTTIAGEFSGNYAEATSGAALGGAIYIGQYGSSKAADLIFFNSSFTDNYAKGDENSHGGAIYTDGKTLNLTADAGMPDVGNGGFAFISGNWAGSESNNEAIYMSSEGVSVDFSVLNGGRITVDDKLVSASAYTMMLHGDGVISLNDEIGEAAVELFNGADGGITLKIGVNSATESTVFGRAKLQITSGSVDTIDNKFSAFKFNELHSSSEALYLVDLALIKGKEFNDVFDVSNIVASGTITISGFSMNAFEEKEGSDNVYTFQILRGVENDSIQLAVPADLVTRKFATPEMTSNDILADGIDVCTTESTNDSIKVNGWRDNLAAWAELEVDGALTKKFTIYDYYTQMLTRDIAAGLKGAELSILGQTNSSLNLRGHNLLDMISAGQTVKLTNLSILNPSNNSTENMGSLQMDSVSMDLKIINDGELKITGQMDINNTITSTNPDENKMVIDDSSEVSPGATLVHIKGCVSEQNIILRGNSPATRDAAGDATTITYLPATDAQGNKTAVFDGFRNNSLTMEGGLFHLGSLGIHRLELRDFRMNGGMVYVQKAVIDLDSGMMGGIDASTASYDSAKGGLIWLDDFEIVGEAQQRVVHVKFVDEDMAHAVKDGKGVAKGAEMSGSVTLTDKSLLYNWTVTYNDSSAPYLGMYTLSTMDFTPEVKEVPVTYLTGSYVSMMQVYNYAFEHADLFSAGLPALRRAAREAAICVPAKEVAHRQPATPAGMGRGLWLRTYAAREDMPLRHGPKVSVDMYGGLVGGDSPLYEHSRGWASVYTLYGGYLGSNQKYDTVRVRQNGAVAGATATFYKGKFHMAYTATIGTSAADTTDRGGCESFDMLMGGVAARAGYNIELASGRYILQPQLKVSYSCFAARDYTNASGVRIEAGDTKVLQFHPSLKLIKNAHGMWNPYVTAGFVYNDFDHGCFRADGMELPGMSVKPYAEYSIGAQRTSGRHTIYGQITGHSGGRQGVESSIGIRREW